MILVHDPFDFPIFTMIRHEPYFLKRWLRHHRPLFRYLYVLCHQTLTQEESILCQQYDATTIIIYSQYNYCWEWLTDTVNKFATYLHHSHDAVAYTDVDEFIVPCNPLPHTEPALRCYGINLVHDFRHEPPLNPEHRLSTQRHWYQHDLGLCKPAIKFDSNYNWVTGCHHLTPEIPLTVSQHHFLVHLHFADLRMMQQRHQVRGGFEHIGPEELMTNAAAHNFSDKWGGLCYTLNAHLGGAQRLPNWLHRVIDAIDLRD